MKDLVFITGGSGHLGFRVIITALEAGYRVRAAVRNQEKITAIKATQSIKVHLESVEFVLVPDITQDGAYDHVLKDVKYIIHCASPLIIQTDDFERDIINPAVKGTLGILNSASKTPTIKRVVITSSYAAIMSFAQLFMVEDDTIFNEKSTTPPPQGPYQHGPAEAYCAAKALALQASNNFVITTKPSFDIINTLPTFFVGKNELVTSLDTVANGTTNGMALTPILGIKALLPRPGNSIYINDVAKVQVLALDLRIEGNQNFMMSSQGIEGTKWDEGIEIVKRIFPKAVEEGIFSLDGTLPTKLCRVDSSRTEEVFGFKLASYETQVKSIVEHYLEILSQ